MLWLQAPARRLGTAREPARRHAGDCDGGAAGAHVGSRHPRGALIYLEAEVAQGRVYAREGARETL